MASTGRRSCWSCPRARNGKISGMAKRESVFSKPSFPRTFALTIAGIAVIFFVDTFLAKKERSESLVEARRFYEAGQRFLQQGLNERAAEQFRSALSEARDNQEYQLAWGRALIGGRPLFRCRGDAERSVAAGWYRRRAESCDGSCSCQGRAHYRSAFPLPSGDLRPMETECARQSSASPF